VAARAAGVETRPLTPAVITNGAVTNSARLAASASEDVVVPLDDQRVCARRGESGIQYDRRHVGGGHAGNVVAAVTSVPRVLVAVRAARADPRHTRRRHGVGDTGSATRASATRASDTGVGDTGRSRVDDVASGSDAAAR
jgi:hypothetical protein